jgi:hypothetical protein
MARYLNLPMVPIMYLRPTRASFDNPGSGIDAGNGVSVEFAGGGIITATYERCVLQGDDTERHEVINWLGARGNGGFRLFNVPIINHGIGPFPIINGRRRPIISGIPHSDGSLFSDASGYSQSTVWATLLESAALNAGQIRIRIYGASRDLRWSDWFSIYHDQNGDKSKGWRSYRFWESEKTAEGTELVESVSLSFRDYLLAIAPPLREATAAGTRIEFARPTCAMKFPQGFTLPWDYEAWYHSRPTLQFEEAK